MFMIDDVIEAIAAGAAIASASAQINESAKSASGARNCTLTITNQSPCLIRPSKNAETNDHGGCYIDFSSLLPKTQGTIRFESGGVLTGAESAVWLDCMTVPYITKAEAEALSDDSKRRLLLGMFTASDDILYVPSKASKLGVIAVRVNNPYAGVNHYGVLWTQDYVDPGNLIEGPTGEQSLKLGDTGWVINWHGSAGNNATMSLEITA